MKIAMEQVLPAYPSFNPKNNVRTLEGSVLPATTEKWLKQHFHRKQVQSKIFTALGAEIIKSH